MGFWGLLRFSSHLLGISPINASQLPTEPGRLPLQPMALPHQARWLGHQTPNPWPGQSCCDLVSDKRTPWAQRHPGTYLASSSWTAPQTTAAGLSACTPAGSPTFCSCVHSQWAACLLRFDQDRGVLGSGSGTISMMHFDSLGRAYALNPQEKGLSEGRGAHGSLQKAPRTQGLAEEAPGSAAPCCLRQAHCGSGRRPQPVLQSKR